MRLETPVLYFHLPTGQTAPLPLSVHVAFHGGWLTQYFPNAHPDVRDAKAGADLPPITVKTVGTLSWDTLFLNSNLGSMPKTTDRVWTAPRSVESDAVTTGAEREQFLFYRGVGHLDAPLRVVRHNENLEIRPAADGGLTIPEIWLVDVLADGSVAFRTVPKAGPGEANASRADFLPQDYSRQNLAALRTALHGSLVANGLFGDEADALLNTWDRSYFQNPGQRLFFIVPQA